MTSQRLIEAFVHRTLLPVSASLVLATGCLAAETTVSINALTSETQRTSENPDRIGLAWWLPLEFWETSMAMGPVPSTPEQISAFTSVLRNYTLFAVVDGVVGQFGGVAWVSAADLRESVFLQDAAGTRYAPLAEGQLSPDARNLAASMKPMLANTLGPMGEHMEFFFFPGTSPDGRQIADAKAEGSFRFLLAENAYEWRLPLGSLLPTKICPVDGEELSGAWKYCPWHGKKLQPK